MKKILILIALFTALTFITADTNKVAAEKASTTQLVSVASEKVSTTQLDSVAVDVITSNLQADGEGYDWGWIVGIAIAILETIARIYPTKKNISLISLIVRLLNIILPNLKRKQKPTDKKQFEI